MTSQLKEEETLVFLDFTDKLPSDILKSQVFFRVANLDTPNPLVQVNDLIFKGTLQNCIGTNMFFKRTEENDILEFPYREASTTKLDFLHLQSKVIACKQMRVSTKEIPLPDNNDNVQFNLNWDYKTLLKKFENGTLDYRYLITNEGEKIDNCEETPLNESASNTEDVEEVSENKNISENMEVEEVAEISHEVLDKQLSNELSEAYKSLLLLASTPVKRKITEELEVPCLPPFKNNFEYSNIECKILSRPLFSYYNHQKTKSLEDNINLNRSALFGLIPPLNNQPKQLTDEEKNAVLTVENLENLDLPARLLVLTAQMREMETQIELNTAEQNNEKDEFGRSPLETLSIYQRLVNALQKRIQEIC